MDKEVQAPGGEILCCGLGNGRSGGTRVGGGSLVKKSGKVSEATRKPRDFLSEKGVYNA